MTARFCPKCGAMQGNWKRCGVCGTRLPRLPTPEAPGAPPLGGLPPERAAVLSIALYVVALMIGLILVGVVCVLLVQLVM